MTLRSVFERWITIPLATIVGATTFAHMCYNNPGTGPLDRYDTGDWMMMLAACCLVFLMIIWTIIDHLLRVPPIARTAIPLMYRAEQKARPRSRRRRWFSDWILEVAKRTLGMKRARSSRAVMHGLGHGEKTVPGRSRNPGKRGRRQARPRRSRRKPLNGG